MNKDREYRAGASKQSPTVLWRFNRSKQANAADDHEKNKRPERGCGQKAPFRSSFKVVVMSVVEEQIVPKGLIRSEGVLKFSNSYTQRISCDQPNCISKDQQS